MNFQQLELLREVAQQGSISAAADVLGYTQPTASRQIAQLELEVGCQLLVRQSGGVEVTAAGQTLLGHAEVILARVNAARTELALQSAGTESVTLATFENLMVTFVPTAVRAFAQRRPGTQVHFRVCLPTSVFELARSRTVDVAIGLVEREDPDTHRPDTSLSVIDLYEEELMCVVPRSHPLATCDEVRVADLADEKFALGAFETCPLYREFARACRGHGFTPHREYRIDDLSASLGLVAAGAALAVVPRGGISLDMRGIAALPFDEPLRATVAAYVDRDAGESVMALVGELRNAAEMHERSHTSALVRERIAV